MHPACRGQEEQALWAPTLHALAASAAPCVFTAYNGEEAEKDAGAWVRAGGAVTRVGAACCCSAHVSGHVAGRNVSYT